MDTENEKNILTSSVKNTDKSTLTTKKTLSLSQRAADSLTKKMGSWGFITTFGVYLFVWMGINIFGAWSHWDPYPFILLNLTLSCLAAIQAPIILMSQNRSAERDHIRFEYDYAINRKAVREIQNMQKDLESIKKSLEGLKR
jgi:uncharacterized membrane protein